MEESVSLFGKTEETFGFARPDVRAYSPLALAYIGDGVYELLVRTVVVGRANRPAGELHKRTVGYVQAGAQAALAEAMSDMLTGEERDVYRRGRNARPHSPAKNAGVNEYRKATGFEALIGYLYLTDRMDRAMELIKTAAAKAGFDL